MLLVLLLLHLLLVEGGRVRLARDGGYRGLVVNVGDDVLEEECAVLVDRIKVSQRHHHGGGLTVMKSSISVKTSL